MFSFGTLTYADGTTKTVWLPDATVEYLDGKHIALFLVAILILVIGLVYTILIFSWQWLLRLPNWKIFKWSRYFKLQAFIETYHTPYIARHCYWTGLLLLVRAILYLVAAVNVSNSPQIALTSIILTIGGLFFLKEFLGTWFTWVFFLFQHPLIVNSHVVLSRWYWEQQRSSCLHFCHHYPHYTFTYHPVPCLLPHITVCKATSQEIHDTY